LTAIVHLRQGWLKARHVVLVIVGGGGGGRRLVRRLVVGLAVMVVIMMMIRQVHGVFSSAGNSARKSMQK
jgi:hypothetical protein